MFSKLTSKVETGKIPTALVLGREEQQSRPPDNSVLLFF